MTDTPIPDWALVEAAKRGGHTDVFGPHGTLVQFTAACRGLHEAVAKMKATIAENDLKRTAAYKRGYDDGLRAAISRAEGRS